jgi:pimeloyl-ACP methyl ester carboxylesterase
MKILRWLGWLLLAVLVLLLATGLYFYRADLPIDTLRAKYAGPPSQFITVDGLSVHFRDEGPPTDSVPLVLLHGTGASLLTWNGWVSALKTNHRVIRLDLPAYGLTGPNATGNYSATAYVAFLTAFLDKIGVKQCDLGGNSLGGGVAWRFALAHPARVGRLVLVDAAGYPLQSQSVPLAFRLARVPGLNRLLTYITPRAVIEQSLKNVYADPARVSNALVDQYLDMALRTGNRAAFIDRLAGAGPDSAWQQMAQIRQPTLVLWGGQDRLIPVVNARRFHADLPHDTLVIMPNAGHVPMEELPAASVRVVQTFLATVPAPR